MCGLGAYFLKISCPRRLCSKWASQWKALWKTELGACISDSPRSDPDYIKKSQLEDPAVEFLGSSQRLRQEQEPASYLCHIWRKQELQVFWTLKFGRSVTLEWANFLQFHEIILWTSGLEDFGLFKSKLMGPGDFIQVRQRIYPRMFGQEEGKGECCFWLNLEKFPFFSIMLESSYTIFNMGYGTLLHMDILWCGASKIGST